LFRERKEEDAAREPSRVPFASVFVVITFLKALDWRFPPHLHAFSYTSTLSRRGARKKREGRRNAASLESE
jgi:hypothetical protein